MGGRAWTSEEVYMLEELSAKYPLSTVARKLNRSVNSVFLKRQRLGIGGFRDNSDMVTRNTLAQILGVENKTIMIWQKKGLKSIRKKPYVMFRHCDILQYMEDHQDSWNAARVTDDSLFMKFDWYKEKKQKDSVKKYNWTEKEEARLNLFRQQGFSIGEIAKRMDRSESSIKYKLYHRRNK